ncbi:MAG: histidine phosphatase family protein [Candidatus Paceibacterota bacterium]|jgi:broad specificity phosphatase PhoE
MNRLGIKFFTHATTFDNENGVSTGSLDVPISPLGKRQIVNLHEAIRKDVFHKVFSSDLVRALQTAKGALGDRYEIMTDARLREINIGDLSGQLDSFTGPLSSEYIDKPYPNGESYDDVEIKMRSFLKNAVEQNPNGRIAIFAHQAPQLALEVITKNLSWKEAMNNDWRNSGSFQYGWEYVYEG